VLTRGKPQEEPSAGKPLARICEGESRMAELLDIAPAPLMGERWQTGVSCLRFWRVPRAQSSHRRLILIWQILIESHSASGIGLTFSLTVQPKVLKFSLDTGDNCPVSQMVRRDPARSDR
jgi:hypothetical protein